MDQRQRDSATSRWRQVEPTYDPKPAFEVWDRENLTHRIRVGNHVMREIERHSPHHPPGGGKSP